MTAATEKVTGMALMSVVSAGTPAEPGHYVQWGVISISLTNLSIILIMIVVFVLAILVPMGGGRHVDVHADPPPRDPPGGPVDAGDGGRR